MNCFLGKIAITIGLIWIMQSNCQGGFVFAFNTTATDEAFLAAPGASVSVPVYLVQTDGEARLTNIGLFSAGVSVAYSHGNGPATNASVTSATLAPYWENVPVSRLDLRPNLVVLEGIVPDVAQPAPVVSNAVLLGTIQFQAGVLNNVTNLTLSLNEVTGNANNLVNATEITPITFRSGTITAVPEPSSLCLLAPVAWMASILRRKRKRGCSWVR